MSIIERPSIASIELDGNKALKTEELMKGLNEAGLAEGQVLKDLFLMGLHKKYNVNMFPKAGMEHWLKLTLNLNQGIEWP